MLKMLKVIKFEAWGVTTKMSAIFSKSQQVLYCCSTEAKFLAKNLLELVSYSKFLAKNLLELVSYSKFLAKNLLELVSYSKFLAKNLLELVSYSKFGFSTCRPAKGECLARKVKDKEVYSSSTEGRQLFFFEL